jgi:hypothetical protein
MGNASMKLAQIRQSDAAHPLCARRSDRRRRQDITGGLAQVESTGNPVARTYWRWQLTWNPFAVYKPASSAVGMYQMTDAAYAEAARYCIRGNAVVDTDCGFTGLYTRAVPSHAIELAAVYLDHNVAAVSCPRARRSGKPAAEAGSRRIHPSLRRRSRLGFQMMAGERCGDHRVAAYLAKVNAMKRQFLRLAANGRN